MSRSHPIPATLDSAGNHAISPASVPASDSTARQAHPGVSARSDPARRTPVHQRYFRAKPRDRKRQRLPGFHAVSPRASPSHLSGLGPAHSPAPWSDAVLRQRPSPEIRTRSTLGAPSGGLTCPIRSQSGADPASVRFAVPLNPGSANGSRVRSTSASDMTVSASSSGAALGQPRPPPISQPRHDATGIIRQG
jgi:hypothetical protein